MIAYKKFIHDIYPFQEGNESCFQFNLGRNFPVDEVTDITFQVRRINGNELITKTLLAGEIIKEGILVTIPITSEDTLNKAGQHVYEVDFKNSDGKPFITMGGSFIVNKQINTK